MILKWMFEDFLDSRKFNDIEGLGGEQMINN